MTKKIELVFEDKNGKEETKTFYQPARIKGKAARVGLKIGKKMEELEDGIPDDALLDEMLQFVSEYGYNNQFTADELENGLDSRVLFQRLSEEIGSIMSDNTESTGKPTKAKKA